jgi:hypothetical protein
MSTRAGEANRHDPLMIVASSSAAKAAVDASA